MDTTRPDHELPLPVSVVIPMLNEAATLVELLEGLKAQTARPTELIFVDAGAFIQIILLLQCALVFSLSVFLTKNDYSYII